MSTATISRKDAVVLPLSYTALDNEEMTYLEGGGIPVTTSLLNKSNCMNYGIQLQSTVGISAPLIARELYAHAVLYYGSPVAYPTALAMGLAALGGLGALAVNAGFDYIRSHANPVDLGGDSQVRLAIFDWIWNTF